MTLFPDRVTLKNGNVPLEVRQYGDISSPPVILLHGGPGVPDEMTEIWELLSEKNHVITFDQRGCGNSRFNNCTFTIPEYIKDINTIAAHFNLKEFYLFGHSWGGLYAQLYAKEYPQKISGLFLCSPGPGTGKIWELAEREIFLYNWHQSTMGEFAVMTWNTILGKLGSNNAYRNLFRQIIINYHKDFKVPPPVPEKLAGINARASIETRNAIKKYPALDDFGKTPYPVIITYGESDAYTASKNHVFRRFPFADVHIIPKCGHTAWKHNPGEFLEIVNDFFSGQKITKT